MYKPSEQAFKGALRQLVAENIMTLDQLKENSKLYEAFAGSAYDFTKSVVVKSYTNLFCAAELDEDEFIDDIVFEVVICNLNRLLALACNNQNPVGYIVKASKNWAYYAIRQFYRKTRIPIGDDEAVHRFIISTEEAEWGLPSTPPADEPLMMQATQAERLARVEEAILLFCELPRFDITSLLGTKVMRIKASKLATHINESGLIDTSNSIFQAFIHELDTSLPSLTMDVFGAFKHDRVPVYNSLAELSAHISRASYSAETTLARKMGVKRNRTLR